MAVRLICHLVSGEQLEILSDKEQGLEEANHARTRRSTSARSSVAALPKAARC